MNRLAEVEEKKGNEVRVGFLKIKIKESWYKWNENIGSLSTENEQNKDRTGSKNKEESQEVTADEQGMDERGPDGDQDI